MPMWRLQLELQESVLGEQRGGRRQGRSERAERRDQDERRDDADGRRHAVGDRDRAVIAVRGERRGVEAKRRVDHVADREDAQVQPRRLVTLSEREGRQGPPEGEGRRKDRERQDGDPDRRPPVQLVRASDVATVRQTCRQRQVEDVEARRDEEVERGGWSDDLVVATSARPLAAVRTKIGNVLMSSQTASVDNSGTDAPRTSRAGITSGLPPTARRIPVRISSWMNSAP